MKLKDFKFTINYKSRKISDHGSFELIYKKPYYFYINKKTEQVTHVSFFRYLIQEQIKIEEMKGISPIDYNIITSDKSIYNYRRGSELYNQFYKIRR